MAIRSRLFYYYVLLIVIYAGFTLLVTPARASLTHYHITTGAVRALSLTVLLPQIAIWLAALYGYQRIRAYSRLVQQTEDGDQVSKLADGLLAIAVGQPLMATVNRVFSMMARSHHSFAPVASIVNSYGSLLYVLIAFVLISQAARGLSEIVKERPTFLATQLLALLIIGVGVLYSYLISNSHNNVRDTFHLPLWAVLSTIVVPYIFIWFNGLLAAYEIRLYSANVPGVVYRKIWNYVAIGVATIIGSSIVLQYVTTLSRSLRNMSLGWLLLIIYCLLGLIALGFILVALGAKRLSRIEEV